MGGSQKTDLIEAWTRDVPITFSPRSREAFSADCNGWKYLGLSTDRSGDAIDVIVNDPEIDNRIYEKIEADRVTAESFVDGKPALGEPAQDLGHGVSSGWVIAANAAGISPQVQLHLHRIAVHDIAQGHLPVCPEGECAGELPSVVAGLFRSAARVLQRWREQPRFAVFLVAAQFVPGEGVDRDQLGGCLQYYVEALRAVEVVWVAAAGNASYKDFWPAVVPGVLAVAALGCTGQGGWVPLASSRWYSGKSMYLCPQPHTSDGFATTQNDSSGASAVMAGMLALTASRISSERRTLDVVLTVVNRHARVFPSERGAGFVPVAVSNPNVFYEETNMPDMRANQKNWRRLYKALIMDEKFTQTDTESTSDTMPESAAFRLHSAVVGWHKARKAGEAGAELVPLWRAAAQGIVDEVLPAKHRFDVSDEEMDALSALFSTTHTLAALAPYQRPEDPGSSVSAW